MAAKLQCEICGGKLVGKPGDFLEEVMDEDHVDDIFEYFRESDTDDLETAMEELGTDYSEDEVRLVRIKFLSDMAN